MRLVLATALALVTAGATTALAPAAHADTAPTTVTVSAPSFRPAPDGFEDTVTIAATFDPSATSVTLTVDSGTRSWTLTPTPGSGQVSQVWDGTGTGGTDGLAAVGSHTITAVAHTPTGDVTSQINPTVTVLIDTIAATRDIAFTAKDGLVKDLSGRCAKLQMPSAHRWHSSIGFAADAKCGTARKTYAEGIFAIRPLGTFDGHTVHDYTTVQVSVYGGAAPGRYHASTGLLVLRDLNRSFLQPTKLTSKVGWHTGRTVPAPSVMFSDHSFAWDVVTLQHAHYDVRAFKVTLGYTYLY